MAQLTDVMSVVDVLLTVPLDKREQFGFEKHGDFVRRYPKLFRVLSTSDTFDRTMLERFVAMAQRADIEKATEEVTADLQNRYVVPVLSRLNEQSK